MDSKLCQFIGDKQKVLVHYKQFVFVNINDEPVDISCSIGPNAVTPQGLLDQPSVFTLHSKFRFPLLHKGPEALEDIIKILQNGCPGCTTIYQRNGNGQHGNLHQLSYSKYRVKELEQNHSFTPGKFRQEGTNLKPSKDPGL